MPTWFSAPFEAVGQPAWGMILLTALLIAVVGATWRVKVSGGITPGERRAHDPRWHPAARLAGVLFLATPWIVVFCAAHFIAPLRPGETLVLLSRSRLPVRGSSGGDWLKKEEELREGLAGSRRAPLDADPVVGEVLGRLGPPPPGGWQPYDPSTIDRVRDALRYVLVTKDVSPRRTPPQRLVSPPASETLPPWLVESVELSVLKGLSRRYNVRRIAALVSDRPGAVGRVWDGVEDALKGGRERDPIEVELFRVREVAPLVLQRVLGAWPDFRDGRQGMVVDFVAVASSSCDQPVCPGSALREVRTEAVLRRGETDVARNVLELTLRSEPRIVRLDAFFPGLAEDLDQRTLALELRGVGPVQSLALAADDPRQRAGGSLREVRILVPAAEIPRWEATTQLFRAAAGATVGDWQKRMAALGFSLRGERGGEPLSFKVRSCQDDEGGEKGVTLDACGNREGRRGLWIRPSAYALQSPVEAQEVGGAIVPHLRGRTLPRGLPGSDAWDGLPLIPATFTRPGRSSAQGFVPLAEAWALNPDLLDGPRPVSGQGPWPFVWRSEQEIKMPGETAPRLAVVTFIGLDPQEQGWLLRPDGEPPEGFEVERFLAGWAQILESLHAAAITQGVPWMSGLAEEGDHPRNFLNGSDLNLVSGRGLWAPLLGLILGTLLYAVVVLLGLWSIPGRR